MVLSIRIKGVEKTAKTGNKFVAWKCMEKDGTWVQLKYTKNVKSLPNAGVYDMSVESTLMNKSTNDYGKVWWVDDPNATFTTPKREDNAIDAF